MGLDLTPYQGQRAKAQADFVRSLGAGTDAPSTIAVLRETVTIMDDELQRPGVIAAWGSSPHGAMTAPEAWRLNCVERAGARFSARAMKPDEWTRKQEEYRQVVTDIRDSAKPDYMFKDDKNGIGYLTQINPAVREALAAVIRAFGRWQAAHSADPDYLTKSARQALLDMLVERQDVLAALRLSQSLQIDVETWTFQVDRPLFVEVVEIGISLVPVLGTTVALYEVYTGRDLFGYALDPITRGVMAACVLLPAAGRVVKYGRVLYTAGRLERLYGADAARWTVTLAVGERFSNDVKAIRALRRAQDAVRLARPIEQSTVQEIADALARLDLRHATAPRVSTMPKYVGNAIKSLLSSRASLGELDELAIQRVVAKGPVPDAMKGQLLEELLEGRIAPWLRDAAGHAALGLKPPPEGLIFIPGHLIRDARGRQLTDGVLAVRRGDSLIIYAVFEVKAGARCSRELASASSGGISSLSNEERGNLRAYAADVLDERLEEARRAGSEATLSADQRSDRLAEIEREMIQTEWGGQVTRDVERMAENEDGTATVIKVGGEELKVVISPTRTRFFGVLPRDVSPGNMAEKLVKQGYRFEIFGLNITQKELEGLARDLLPLATPITP